MTRSDVRLEPQRLPRLLVLTDRHQLGAGPPSLAALVGELAGCGDVAVVLREKDLAPAPRLALGEEVAAATRAAGLPLVVASDVSLARRVRAAGVHLAAADPRPLGVGDRLWGRSCHAGDDLAGDATSGAAWISLSPVRPSAGKPGYGPALGLAGLARLAARCPVPVYALGGIDAGSIAGACVAAGAHGVAVQGAVMAAAHPGEVVRALLAEVHEGLGTRPG